MFLVDNPPHNIKGDFCLDSNLIKNKPNNSTNSTNTTNSTYSTNTYTFTGIAIYHYSLFENIKLDKEQIDLFPIINQAINKNLIQGKLLDKNCKWYDVGTIDTLDMLNSI